MKKLVRKIAQNFANSIIEKMRNAKTEKEVNRLYSMGMALNSYCISRWEIYLD